MSRRGSRGLTVRPKMKTPKTERWKMVSHTLSITLRKKLTVEDKDAPEHTADGLRDIATGAMVTEISLSCGKFE